MACDEASSPQCPPNAALRSGLTRQLHAVPAAGGHPRRVTVWIRRRVPLGTSLSHQRLTLQFLPHPSTGKEAFGGGGGIFPKLQKMISHFRERMCLLPSFTSSGLRPGSTPRRPPSPLPLPLPSPHLAEGEMPARWSHAAGLGTIGSCLEHAAASTHIWRPAQATPVLIWRERAGRFVS